MELNWSTFLLEIINFVVLVWILKRFLYQPVLAVIARRREAIEAQLAEARQQQDEAQGLKIQYESRLADWDEERRTARGELAREMDEERASQLAKLQELLAQEREKSRVAEARQQSERQRAIEHQALLQGAAFSTRLLTQASGPELEARLLAMLVTELQQLPAEQLAGLRQQWGSTPAAIEVSSAFELSDAQRQSLEDVLREVSGLGIPVHYRRDAELLAGLHIAIGAWVLAANVRDELQGFVEFAHAPR